MPVHVHKSLWSLLYLTKANFQGNTVNGAGFEGFVEDKTTDPIQDIVLGDNRLNHLEDISSDPGSLRELHLISNAFEGKLPHEFNSFNNIKVLHVS